MYSLIEIATTTSGTARSMTPKNDWDAALMSLHQAMASAIANANANGIVCEIMDDNGMILKRDEWERVVT